MNQAPARKDVSGFGASADLIRSLARYVHRVYGIAPDTIETGMGGPDGAFSWVTARAWDSLVTSINAQETVTLCDWFDLGAGAFSGIENPLYRHLLGGVEATAFLDDQSLHAAAFHDHSVFHSEPIGRRCAAISIRSNPD